MMIIAYLYVCLFFLKAVQSFETTLSDRWIWDWNHSAASCLEVQCPAERAARGGGAPPRCKAFPTGTLISCPLVKFILDYFFSLHFSSVTWMKAQMILDLSCQGASQPGSSSGSENCVTAGFDGQQTSAAKCIVFHSTCGFVLFFYTLFAPLLSPRCF